MTDDATTTSAPAPAAPDATAPDSAPAARRCPWCSEILPAEATGRCPHCQASLVAEGEARLPGLTEVEAPSTTKLRRAESPRRSKLLSWISGEIDDADLLPLGNAVAPDALALPPHEVRLEMLRLQLEAEGVTVNADGSIERPDANASQTPNATPSSSAPADAAVEPEAPAEIRQAS